MRPVAPVGKPAVQISVQKANAIGIASTALRQKLLQARLVEGAEPPSGKKPGQDGAVHLARVVIELHLDQSRANPRGAPRTALRGRAEPRDAQGAPAEEPQAT